MAVGVLHTPNCQHVFKTPQMAHLTSIEVESIAVDPTVPTQLAQALDGVWHVIVSLRRSRVLVKKFLGYVCCRRGCKEWRRIPICTVCGWGRGSHYV